MNKRFVAMTFAAFTFGAQPATQAAIPLDLVAGGGADCSLIWIQPDASCQEANTFEYSKVLTQVHIDRIENTIDNGQPVVWECWGAETLTGTAGTSGQGAYSATLQLIPAGGGTPVVLAGLSEFHDRPAGGAVVSLGQFETALNSAALYGVLVPGDELFVTGATHVEGHKNGAPYPSTVSRVNPYMCRLLVD